MRLRASRVGMGAKVRAGRRTFAPMIQGVCLRAVGIWRALTSATPVLAAFALAAVASPASRVLAQAAPAIAELPEVRDGRYLYFPGLSYASDADGIRRELDLYLPAADTAAPVVAWLHGGGLTGGAPHLPDGLRDVGLGVAVVRYRLGAGVPVREKVEDAAAAVAWLLGGVAGRVDGGAIAVAGHSAGGYLAAMVTVDTGLLGAHGHHPDELLASIPLSGHAITHFTERAARGMPATRAVVDSLAPLYHVRRVRTPILLITGDRERELYGRYEENAYFWRMLRLAGSPDVELFELGGYGHGMVAPALPLLVDFVRGRLRERAWR